VCVGPLSTIIPIVSLVGPIVDFSGVCLRKATYVSKRQGGYIVFFFCLHAYLFES